MRWRTWIRHLLHLFHDARRVGGVQARDAGVGSPRDRLSPHTGSLQPVGCGPLALRDPRCPLVLGLEHVLHGQRNRVGPAFASQSRIITLHPFPAANSCRTHCERSARTWIIAPRGLIYRRAPGRSKTAESCIIWPSSPPSIDGHQYGGAVAERAPGQQPIARRNRCRSQSAAPRRTPKPIASMRQSYLARTA